MLVRGHKVEQEKPDKYFPPAGPNDSVGITDEVKVEIKDKDGKDKNS